MGMGSLCGVGSGTVLSGRFAHQTPVVSFESADLIRLRLIFVRQRQRGSDAEDADLAMQRPSAGQPKADSLEGEGRVACGWMAAGRGRDYNGWTDRPGAVAHRTRGGCAACLHKRCSLGAPAVG